MVLLLRPPVASGEPVEAGAHFGFPAMNYNLLSSNNGKKLFLRLDSHTLFHFYSLDRTLQFEINALCFHIEYLKEMCFFTQRVLLLFPP